MILLLMGLVILIWIIGELFLKFKRLVKEIVVDYKQLRKIKVELEEMVKTKNHE